MIWVIVLKMTVLTLSSPVLLSDTVFPSKELCEYVLNGEPGSDRATCRPLRLAQVPGFAEPEKPKGEPIDPQ